MTISNVSTIIGITFNHSIQLMLINHCRLLPLTGRGEVAFAELDIECVAVRTVAHLGKAQVAVLLATIGRVLKAEATVEGTEHVLNRLQTAGNVFACIC